jgi:hypothetical protein
MAGSGRWVEVDALTFTTSYGELTTGRLSDRVSKENEVNLIGPNLTQAGQYLNFGTDSGGDMPEFGPEVYDVDKGFSVSLKFKPTADFTQYLWGDYSTPGGPSAWTKFFFRVGNSGRLGIAAGHSPKNMWHETAYGSMVEGVEYHVVLIVKRWGSQVYLNGELIFTDSGEVAYEGSAGFLRGFNIKYVNRYTSNIKQALVYNRILSEKDIELLYNS